MTDPSPILLLFTLLTFADSTELDSVIVLTRFLAAHTHSCPCYAKIWGPKVAVSQIRNFLSIDLVLSVPTWPRW